MVTATDNIESLSQTVQADAKAAADKVLADARAKAEAARQKYREQADAERAKILERAKQDSERLQRETVATAQLKARTQQLADREKQLDNVFQRANQQLKEVLDWDEYPQVARQMLREALVHLGAPSAQVRVDSATRRALTDAVAAEVSKELKVEVKFGEELDEEIGVIAETADGRMRYDNTLQTRLSRMQNALRTPVYHLLMGESK